MLVDSFGRTIDYIRISVTERCNFRCVYCMPNTPMDLGREEDDVPLEGVLNFIKVAIDEEVIPFPRELKTPPVTKIYFVSTIQKPLEI